MAETPTSHTGENTPEYVAYRLYLDVMALESSNSNVRRDRNYILNTYAECLVAVHRPDRRVMA